MTKKECKMGAIRLQIKQKNLKCTNFLYCDVGARRRLGISITPVKFILFVFVLSDDVVYERSLILGWLDVIT